MKTKLYLTISTLFFLSISMLQAQDTWGSSGNISTWTNGRVAIGNNSVQTNNKLNVFTSQDAYTLYLQNNTPAIDLPQINGICNSTSTKAAFTLFAEAPIAENNVFSYAGFFQKKLGICDAELDLFDIAGYQWRISTLSNNQQTLSFTGGEAANAPLLLHGEDGSMDKITPESASVAFTIKNDLLSESNVFEIAPSGQVIHSEGLRILTNNNERPFEIYSEEKGENVLQIMKGGKIFSTEIEVKLLGLPTSPLSQLILNITQHLIHQMYPIFTPHIMWMIWIRKKVN